MYLKLRDLTRVYPNGTVGLKGVDLDVAEGELLAILGPSGSGKTTLLRLISGLEPPTRGEIFQDGKPTRSVPPHLRGIGLVPQDGALFDHLSVRRHLGFALEVRGWSAERREARVRELADWLHLGPLLDRLPAGLSGGERQRVALGRALSFEPPVLCLDEPLSALDDQTRQEILGLLAGLRSRSAITLLHITHNRSEAEQLADRILHLRDGRLES